MNCRMRRYLSLLLPALLLPAVARAQAAPPAVSVTPPVALPDPATITVPDVSPSSDPKVRSEGYKFYYFNNPAVSFAEAYQDVAECRAHLAIGGGAQVPGFIPWDQAHRRKVYQGGGFIFAPNLLTAAVSGVVTAGLAAIILPKMERGARSNKMRRCMGTRGYVRYAIPEAAFDALNKGDEAQLIAMQAKLASAPKPQDEAVADD
jgi:hypothetical protein